MEPSQPRRNLHQKRKRTRLGRDLLLPLHSVCAALGDGGLPVGMARECFRCVFGAAGLSAWTPSVQKQLC